MPTKQETISAQTVSLQRCCHHWLIETATRSIGIGVCRLCGEKREFRNDLFALPQTHSEKHQHNRRPDPLNGRRNGDKKGAKGSHGAFTIEDFRRWGKMGGRGNKKNKEAEA